MPIIIKKMPSNTLADLQAMLQQAIELEHSTIPPYLTANFTLYSQTSTTNSQISKIIGSVLGEEMLHMTLACNVLNAIGGSPVINSPTFIPSYPGHLAGGVEAGLKVGLEKFSINLVQYVFMEIERPEDQLNIPGSSAPVPDDGTTIGEFYGQIITLMNKLGETIFTGNSANQVTFPQFYPSNVLFPVTNLSTAIQAINIIVDQGEGNSSSLDPMVDPNKTEGKPEPSHFYRFEQIVVGKSLEPVYNPRTGTIKSYDFNGPPVPFDPTQVINMYPNPNSSDYPTSSLAFENNKLFNYNYTSLLNCLHETFNGNPDKISTALGLMFSLRLYALKLLAIQHPKYPGYQAGPTFEYQPTL